MALKLNYTNLILSLFNIYGPYEETSAEIVEKHINILTNIENTLNENNYDAFYVSGYRNGDPFGSRI